MRLGKDWTLMLQPHLIHSLEVLRYSTKIGFEGLQIRIRCFMIITVHCVFSVLDFEFNLETLKRFNVGT